jgi:hypothetical protein
MVDVAEPKSDSDRLTLAAALIPRRRFFDEMPDKGLFAVVAVVGFGAILALKLREFDANYVAAGAVLLMIGYGFFAFQFRRIRLRPDRLGDNFYYLGFIFTLASLSAALLLVKRGGAIDELIGSFGIALLTTIVGVAGRVLFVQMRGDIDEVENEVRRDLLSASADLRAQLSLTLAEFETFHTGVQQATRKAAENSVGAAQDAVSNISRVANAAGERIDQSFSREYGKVESLQQGLSKMEIGLKSLAGDLNDRFDEFNSRMDKMISQLATAVDLIGRSKRRVWIWPFRRK